MNWKESDLLRHPLAEALDWLVLVASIVTFTWWFTGQGLLYRVDGPVLSPFTSLSLGLIVCCRLASRHLTTWSKPMSLALIGLVASGNLSSIMIHWMMPELFLKTMPTVVATSVMTSVGIILFCCYEMLVLLRRTPRSLWILDDILLHLALFPGGLSLLGHLLDVRVYTTSSVDPRAGISPLEMLLMAGFTVSAVLSNRHLFLWKFLGNSFSNKLIFAMLFINQYVAAFVFGIFFRSPKLSTDDVGLEFYIMLAGVLATLLFLFMHAFFMRPDQTEERITPSVRL
jgi:hypothetical protein